MKKLLMILAGITFGMNVVAQDVYIPTAFTPNGDGTNDIWKPVFDEALSINHYNLQIFDRDGVMVFSTNEPTDGWDGFPFDTTYIYKLSMKCDGYSEGITKSGTITSIH